MSPTSIAPKNRKPSLTPAKPLKANVQIAEIIKRGQTAYREHKSVKSKAEMVRAYVTKAIQKREQIQAQISSLYQRPIVRSLSRSVVLAGIVGLPTYFASMSSTLGIASAFGASATTYFGARFFRKIRL